MEDTQTLEEFKRMQHKEVQQRKNNYKMNPVTGWMIQIIQRMGTSDTSIRKTYSN